MDPEINQTPVVSQPPAEVPVMPRTRRTWPVVLVVALITALVAGGGVYAYQRSQNATTVDNLQAQIDSLKIQLAASPTPTATPTTTAGASPSPSASGTTACQSSDLSLQLVNNGGGTAGTYYYDLGITNDGKATCTVSGYPTVSQLGSDGSILGKAEHTTLAPSATITLATGQTAYAALGFPVAANFATGVCAAASSLSVTLSGAGTALSLSTADQPNAAYYCPGFSVSALSSTKL